MLHLLYLPSKGRLVLARSHFNRLLNDDRTMVNFFVYEVNRHPAELHPMSQRVSGIGVLLLLVVVAIVLLMTAKAWESMAPAALDVTSRESEGRQEMLQEAVGEDGSHLPDLHEMQQSTQEHADQIQEAIDQIDSQPSQ